MRSFSAPALSARRSRCISPNEGCRWRWSSAPASASRPRIGNAGIIEGNTVFPPAFPADPRALTRIAFKRASEANYHLSFLPQVLPWLLAFRAASQPERLVETAHLIRPLFASAVPSMRRCWKKSGATQYLRKTGWLKVIAARRPSKGLAPNSILPARFGLPLQALDTAGAQALEPSWRRCFRTRCSGRRRRV